MCRGRRRLGRTLVVGDDLPHHLRLVLQLSGHYHPPGGVRHRRQDVVATHRLDYAVGRIALEPDERPVGVAHWYACGLTAALGDQH